MGRVEIHAITKLFGDVRAKDIPELQGDFAWVLVNTKNGWVEVF